MSIQNEEIKRLLKKSIEAFILGLEIYNKPTLRYRIEGFSFFVINAWELMLKAELLKRNISIYFSDHPDRTISCTQAVRLIYSDKNTRIRKNLEKIIELRNISTHFITEDYEIKYAPLFQACVLNYSQELLRFHSIDITDHIPQNFLTLSVNYAPLNNESIRMKYPPEVAEKLIQQANDIDILTESYNSDKFAISIKQNLYLTKRKDKADFLVSIQKESEAKVAFVKDIKDPANTHKYSFTSLLTAISETMKKRNIRIDYEKGFNSYVLSMFIDFYDVKETEEYSYKHVIGGEERFTYSQQLLEFIMSEIQKNPLHFVESLRQNNKKR